jgi:hypothetical protein
MAPALPVTLPPTGAAMAPPGEWYSLKTAPVRHAGPFDEAAVEPDGARIEAGGGLLDDLEVLAFAGFGRDGGMGAGSGQQGEHTCGGREGSIHWAACVRAGFEKPAPW